MVRVLIFDLLTPETFTRNISRKVCNICKVVIYFFGLTSSRTILVKKAQDKSGKNVHTILETKKVV